jgi:hypothetical protein
MRTLQRHHSYIWSSYRTIAPHVWFSMHAKRALFTPGEL